MRMEFKDVADAKNVFSHLLMSSSEVAQAVAKTDDWEDGVKTNSGFVNVQVNFNGVECPPEVLEKLITDWYERMNNSFVKKYEDVEREIELRVSQEVDRIVRDKVDPYVNKLNRAVENINNLPYSNCWMED